MITAFLRAIEQLYDPAVRRVLWISAGGALIGFAGLALLVWIALFQVALIAIPWLDTMVDVLGGFAVIVLAYFLFPAVAGTITGLLLEDVAQAVDRRHYPHLAPARQQSVGEVVLSSVRFFALVVALNLLVLPLYLLPGINLVLYYALNGYLLSREYFEMVALRRLTPADVRGLRRTHGLKLFSAGVIIAFLLTIPFVNLAVPVIATAFMIHVFHGVARRGAAPTAA